MSTAVRQSVAVDDHGMWIGGESRPAASGEWRESVDPYTGLVWARVAEGDAADVDAAVSAARAALETGPWASMSGRARRDLMLELARLMRRDAAKIAEIETRDNGKLLRESSGMLEASAGWYEYFAGWADKIQGDVIPVERASLHVYTRREPIGVVAAITAWNSPVLMAAYKLGPGLAAGCTFVVKPAEVTPMSSLAFVELTKEAGFPNGVINVVTGGPRVGQALVDHRGVDKVAFTGSSATGARVAAAAASHLTPSMLELGGKSAQIVFADADLETASAGIAGGIFAAAGQSCVAGSRLYVQRSVAEEVSARVATLAGNLELGDPLAPSTELGPISFEHHLDRVLGFIERGTAAGAHLVTGGHRATRADLAEGFFVEPTVLDGMAPDAEIIKEEIFGPVLSMATFDSEEEAVALANSSRYGLAAGVWTGRIGRAHRVAQAMQAGTVWVNAYRMVNHAVPFGGFKDSGYGRENGFDSLREFTKTKSIWIETADPL